MKHLKLFEQFEEDPFGEEDTDSYKYNFIKYPNNVIWYKENYGIFSLYQEFEIEKSIKKIQERISKNPNWAEMYSDLLNIFLERLELLRSFRKD